MIKPQSEFPLLKEYKAIFPITDGTIFAYDNDIYTNNQLTPDLLVHEEAHLKQQKKYGLEEWVDGFLHDSKFRLKMELDAYRKQLASIKDRNHRHQIRIVSAETLSSGLYGNIIGYNEAMSLLMQ